MLTEILIAIALLGALATMVVDTGIGGSVRMRDWMAQQAAYRIADISLRNARGAFAKDYNATNTDPFVSSEDAGSLFKTVTATIPWYSRTGTTSLSLSEDVYDWRHARGGDTCNLSSTSAMWKLAGNKSLASTGNLADVDVLGGLVYAIADSSNDTDPDLFIVNALSPTSPTSMSSISVGVGGSAIHVIPGFAFIAEKSARHPLRIININNPSAPTIAGEYDITATSSTGYGYGKSLYYYENRLYLGTEKSVGAEFQIFNVAKPPTPILLGSYEINSQVADIVVRGSVAYISTANDPEVIILDVSDPAHIRQLSTISLLGSATQDGRTLFVVGSTLYIGRTVGGFDNPANHELFAYDVSSLSVPVLKWSTNIAASVNKIIVSRKRILAAVGASKNTFTVFDISSSTPTTTQSFSHTKTAVTLDCGNSVVVIGEENPPRLVFYTQ